MKITNWLKPDKLNQLTEWTKAGITDLQLAYNIGITRSTLYRWKRSSPAIAEAMERGKDEADQQVVNALYSTACAGNVTAIIFWLCNRRPDTWSRNPQYIDQSSNTVQIMMSKELKDYAE